MKKLLLVGIGQEVSLDQMEKPDNFLLFEQENGSRIRIHVPQETVSELITELHTEKTAQSDVPREPPEELEEEMSTEGATEFGGESEEEPSPLQDDEDGYISSEEEVPSL